MMKHYVNVKTQALNVKTQALNVENSLILKIDLKYKKL